MKLLFPILLLLVLCSCSTNTSLYDKRITFRTNEIVILRTNEIVLNGVTNSSVDRITNTVIDEVTVHSVKPEVQAIVSTAGTFAPQPWGWIGGILAASILSGGAVHLNNKARKNREKEAAKKKMDQEAARSGFIK